MGSPLIPLQSRASPFLSQPEEYLRLYDENGCALAEFDNQYPLGSVWKERCEQGLFWGRLMSTLFYMEIHLPQTLVLVTVEMERGLYQRRTDFRLFYVREHQPRRRGGPAWGDDRREPTIVNKLRRPAELAPELLDGRSTSVRS